MEGIFALFERCCFVGHTHFPGVFTKGRTPNEWAFQTPEECDSRFRLDDRKTMINVGSVGQPRDGDWRACYVLLNGDTVHFRRVAYDVETTIRKLRDIPDLPGFYGERLEDGR